MKEKGKGVICSTLESLLNKPFLDLVHVDALENDMVVDRIDTCKVAGCVRKQSDNLVLERFSVTFNTTNDSQVLGTAVFEISVHRNTIVGGARDKVRRCIVGRCVRSSSEQSQ